LRYQGGIAGDFWHSDHGQNRADEITLDRIVVDEDERIEADIQFLSDGPDVARLVIPVHHEGSDVASLEKHLGVRVEGGDRIRFIVLGADGQDYAAPGKITRIALES
jgi:hypothetical protein